MSDLIELKATIEQITSQQLQICQVFEQILEKMEAPDQDGMVKKLEKLLTPLVEDSAQIKTSLGI